MLRNRSPRMHAPTHTHDPRQVEVGDASLRLGRAVHMRARATGHNEDMSVRAA
jgi:hypothetical protein